ncbi:MAG: Cof-type HAD-IIB family hydrolase [Oscillospiraceae bacterium]|nr:Cof-type HAD-IIB family hydrolase [Oscillospiraceae bacterium]
MKIIASDYDGTLRRGSEIDPKDRAAVKKWREAGNLFGIVTGRDAPFIKNFINEDKLDIDFLIIYNGVNIYEFKNDNEPQLVKQLTGKTERLYEMLPLIVKKPGDYADFVTPDAIYRVSYNDEPLKEESWVRGEALKTVKEFIQIYSLYKTETEALETAAELGGKFGGEISPLVNGSWLNAAPAGVNKASGVYEYAKLKSAAKENIFTVGDSYNDLDMIREFNGFTLNNGAAALKETARAVFGGVYEMVDYLLTETERNT